MYMTETLLERVKPPNFKLLLDSCVTHFLFVSEIHEFDDNATTDCSPNQVERLFPSLFFLCKG